MHMTIVGREAISAREAEILVHLGDHLTNAEIGQLLHISVRTVESHVSSLLRKLGAADRRDLAERAADFALAADGGGAEPFGILGLPDPWTRFVGRSRELAEVERALSADRLITLVGPGGVGKTRLAVAAAGVAAAKFSGGGMFVDLAPITSEFLVQAVASALGVVEQPHRPLDQTVLQRLNRSRSLLVFDNCEHVLDTVAAFLRSILSSCPKVVVLATSRVRLGIAGERVVAIAPLPLEAIDGGSGSDAEELFIDRSIATIDMATDGAVVHDICRRLDGMPLAIELAAARSGSLGLDGLLTALDDHLRALSNTSGPDERHGSLRSVIDWSHELLNDDERKAFRQLGVFAGAFDIASAATVFGDGDLARASDVIGRLADQSLLAHGRDKDGSRWWMLDTVRAYARMQLTACADEGAIRARHLEWAAATALEIEASLGVDVDWQSRFDAVVDDLRAAVANSPTRPDQQAFDLALSLGHLLYARRFLAEGRHHLQAAVEHAPDEASAVTALRRTASSARAEMRGEDAFNLLRDAADRAAVSGDTREAALALAEASTIAGRCPATFANPLAHHELTPLIDRTCSLAPAGDPEVDTYIALARAWDGARGWTVPDPARAAEAVEAARRYGDPVLVSSALDAAASSSTYDGRLKEAWRFTAERVRLLDRLPRHDPRAGQEIVDTFHMATMSAMAAGDLREALVNAQRSSIDITNEGLPHFAACHQVIALALLGAFDEALQQAEMMLEGWERAGRHTAAWMSPAFFATAMVYGLRGDEKGYARWWELGAQVTGHWASASCRIFSEARMALYQGRFDAALVFTDDMASATGEYRPYALAVVAEAAAITGRADAGVQLDSLRPWALENDFIAAHELRITGRLRGDVAALEAAVKVWEAVGARFERACTLLLIPERAAEGTSELSELGCPLPSATPLIR
jgi:predicted ATPase/DNA-binding CsgD family transcriptional regulator